VCCGERHTVARLASGNAFAWGWNDEGQLGTGGSQGTHTPQMAKSPMDLRLATLRGMACGPCSTSVWT